MIICNKDNFETEVLKGDGVVVVDFYGETCAPCMAFMPHYVELAETYGDKLKFCKLNIADSRKVAIGEKVMSIPTVIFYKDGERVETLTPDKISKDNMEATIKKYI